MVARIIHGRCIFTDSQIQQALDPAVLAQFLQRNGLPVGGEKFHHFQHTFGDGARLIAE